MGSGYKTIKCLMLMMNTLFVVSGLGLVGLGGYTRYASENYDTIVGKNGLAMPANIMIATGAFVFLVSILGCYGAIKENKCMLVLYIALIVLIMLAEAAGVGLAFFFSSKVEKVVTDGIIKAVQKTYGQKGQDAVTEAVNKVQQSLKCCGANSYKDWYNSTWSKQHNNSLPGSCYDVNGASYVFFQTPCIGNLKQWASKNLFIVGGVGIGVFIIELLGICFAAVIIRGMEAVGAA